MKTVGVIILFCLLLAGLLLLIAFFTSNVYLRSRLSDCKKDLGELPDSEEASNLISRIDSFLPKAYLLKGGESIIISKDGKKHMIRLLWESEKFLAKQVPCYHEHGVIPSYLDRLADDSKCNICNASSCVFHPWQSVPTNPGWPFFRLKSHPNH